MNKPIQEMATTQGRSFILLKSLGYVPLLLLIHQLAILAFRIKLV